MKNTRVLVFMALFIAMDIVLTRMLSFQTLTIRISFGFLPIAFSSILFGPLIGGVTAMISDILGFMMFPKGTFFPGFTLSALLTGLIYGLFLYKKPISLLRVFLAVLTITIFVDLGLNTMWLSILFKKAATAIIAPRLLAKLMFMPIQTAIIYTMWKYVGRFVESHYLQRRGHA